MRVRSWFGVACLVGASHGADVPGLLINETLNLPSLVLPAASGDVTIVTVCRVPLHQTARDLKAWRTICAVLMGNVEAYARVHGYGVVAFDQNNAAPRPIYWAKVPALLAVQTLVRTEFLWWQDADSLFILPSRSLEGLKPREGRSMTISGDYNCYINTGHMMMRNNAWSTGFLRQGGSRGSSGAEG